MKQFLGFIIHFRKWKHPLVYCICFIVLLVLLIPIPSYSPSYSKTLVDKNNELISAVVSNEGQWHLPLDQEVPELLQKAIMLYEDEYFYFHPGINPVSVIKSIYANIRSGKIKRGASTITMQVMRIRNKSSSRSILMKCYESMAALKYSLFNRKSRVLREWCEIAPFGGNTIGARTAAFRYFKRSLHQLSIAEMALLAVMPNTPTTINLSVNRDLLFKRRNRLLAKMARNKVITQDDYELGKEEELPEYPYQVPAEAPHLLASLVKEYPQSTLFQTTIDRSIQSKVTQLINEESELLQAEEINNMAAIVVDVTKNELVAYIGNSKQKSGNFAYVDVLQSYRSYGSLLKPLLYGLALESGTHLPKEYIADTPVNYGEFRPENFDKKFRGIVPLDDIIIQSLNVPSVRLLHELGLNNFYGLIQKLKIKGINKGPDHYGLSVILGGGETTPWEMARIYKGLAQNYLGYAHPYGPVKVVTNDKSQNSISYTFSPFSIEYTISAMSNLSRPREEKSWQLFGYDHKIAWKTGTSYGHKDAWAAGFNGQYQVLVWVGNEIGEGRKDLTGIVRAAPVMFKIFNSLPQKSWFTSKPNLNLKNSLLVCKETGMLKGSLCKNVYSLKTPHTSHHLKTCSHHAIDISGDTILKFHPLVEYYYSAFNPTYKIQSSANAVKLIYPSDGMKIYLPKINAATKNSFKAECIGTGSRIHWYLNDQFLSTTNTHELLINVNPGTYKLFIVDDEGRSDECHFEVIGTDSEG